MYMLWISAGVLGHMALSFKQKIEDDVYCKRPQIHPGKTPVIQGVSQQQNKSKSKKLIQKILNVAAPR